MSQFWDKKFEEKPLVKNSKKSISANIEIVVEYPDRVQQKKKCLTEVNLAFKRVFDIK
jgi:hypothetical protein